MLKIQALSGELSINYRKYWFNSSYVYTLHCEDGTLHRVVLRKQLYCHPFHTMFYYSTAPLSKDVIIQNRVIDCPEEYLCTEEQVFKLDSLDTTKLTGPDHIPATETCSLEH